MTDKNITCEVGTVFNSKVRIKQKRVIDCPVCNDHEFTLSNHKGSYSWSCGNCFSKLSIFIKDNDEVTFEVKEQTYFEVYRLLRFDPALTSGPIYIVAKGGSHCTQHENGYSFNEQDRYYVEEHTCPTNLVGGSDVFFAVQDPSKTYWDTDPHGIFKLESIMKVSDVHDALGITDTSNLQSHEDEAIFKYLLNREITDLKG